MISRKFKYSNLPFEERILALCLRISLFLNFFCALIDIYSFFTPGIIANTISFIIVSLLLYSVTRQKISSDIASTLFILLTMGNILFVFSQSKFIISELMFVIAAPIVAAILKPRRSFLLICFVYYAAFAFINLTPIANIPLAPPYLIQILCLHSALLSFFKFYVDENKILRAQLKLSYQEIQAESITDPLTQILNRKEFQTQMRIKMSQYKRDKLPFVLTIIDIDFFKKINDTFGHLEGDKTLVQISKHIKNSIREVDQVFRFGGEEFIILFHNTNTSLIKNSLQKLKKTIANLPIIPNHPITVSIGYTQIIEGDTYDSFIHRADKALYYVKENGRNNIYTQDNTSRQKKDAESTQN